MLDVCKHIIGKNTLLLPFCIKLHHNCIFRSSKIQVYLENLEKLNSPPSPNHFKTLKPRNTQGDTYCSSLYFLICWCGEKMEKINSWEHLRFGESGNLEQLGKNQDHLKSKPRLRSRSDGSGCTMGCSRTPDGGQVVCWQILARRLYSLLWRPMSISFH